MLTLWSFKRIIRLIKFHHSAAAEAVSSVCKCFAFCIHEIEGSGAGEEECLAVMKAFLKDYPHQFVIFEKQGVGGGMFYIFIF